MSNNRLKSQDLGITWLTPLYDFDNADKLRVTQIGYSPGKFHTGSGLVTKKNGTPGILIPKARVVKPTTINPGLLDAARVYAQQKWNNKVKNSPYRPSEEIPTYTPAEWRATESRRWPAVCANFKDLKAEYINCTPKKTWYMQPKVNGDRITLRFVNGEVKLYSRNCQEKKFLQNIRSQGGRLLKAILRRNPNLGNIEDFGIDGELLAPELEFHQQSRSIIARTVNKHKDENKLVFQIFDLQEYTLPFSQRYGILDSIVEYLETHDYSQLQILPMKIATSIVDIYNYRDAAKENGYEEGIVIRRPNIMYSRFNEFRHKEMLKFKNVEDAEYLVTGFSAGAGDHEGCVIWELQDLDDENVTFTCQYRASLKVQKDLYIRGSEFIGKLLTVEYGSKSATGKPIFPVGVRFREDSDLVPE